jgi:hypothetical protein
MRKLATLEEIEAWLEANGGLINSRYIERMLEREYVVQNEFDHTAEDLLFKREPVEGFRLRDVKITINPRRCDATRWAGDITFIAPFDAPWSIAFKRSGLKFTGQRNRYRERQKVVADMGRCMGWHYVYAFEMRKTAWVKFTTHAMLSDLYIEQPKPNV